MKFSVIVPAYNVEKYLPKCIESITAQTYENLEIILINDGSPDDCLTIMQRYARQDSRIIVVSQENGGLSAARNAGLEIATGDYVAFVDSDDWIEPDMFSELERRIRQEIPDFICFRLQYDSLTSGKCWIYGKPYSIASMEGPDQILRDALEVKNIPTSACSKVYSRRFLDDHSLKFKPGIVNEDTLFSLQTACHAGKVSFVNRVFYHTIERPGSISRSAQDRLFRDMAIALDDAKSYLSLYNRLNNPIIERAYYSRYVKSMLYNIFQAAQRLSREHFNEVHSICMNETDYKKYQNYQLSLSLKYRIMYRLSLHPHLFYSLFKVMYLMGLRMH